VDPAPICAGQVSALCLTTVRELVWGRRAVSREIRRWRTQATAIVDRPLRADALTALTLKRGATDGAALFWTLLPHRDPRVLRLLVAHELIWDFLDCVNERWPDEANGHQLHLAVRESLDPAVPLSDYYRHHPWSRDGGFLTGLVQTCRSLCASLPSYEVVRPFAVREAARATVQALIHSPDRRRRDGELRGWVEAEFPEDPDLSWFELAGAASAPLAIHALLALAGEPACDAQDAEATCAAYFPWVALTTTLLDGYVDEAEDRASGGYSSIAHYPSSAAVHARLQESIERSARGVLALRNGHRHAVVVACMVALYLSNDKARTPELVETTRHLARAGGSLTQLLVPVLRLWRIRYGQQSA
jgi:tetraprenyl-beta-curcumene synthase